MRAIGVAFVVASATLALVGFSASLDPLLTRDGTLTDLAVKIERFVLVAGGFALCRWVFYSFFPNPTPDEANDRLMLLIAVALGAYTAYVTALS